MSKYIPNCIGECWKIKTIKNYEGGGIIDEHEIIVHIKLEDDDYLYGVWHHGGPSETWKFCPHCGEPAKKVEDDKDYTCHCDSCEGVVERE